MNLIAGALRLWSDLTGWDLLLMSGVLMLVGLMLWWVNRDLTRREREEAQAKTQQRLDKVVGLNGWQATRRDPMARVQLRKAEKGDGAT